MIHWVRDGGLVRFGLNLSRNHRTHLTLCVIWRGWTHGYCVGVTLRKRKYGSMVIPRLGRWRWAPGRWAAVWGE